MLINMPEELYARKGCESILIKTLGNSPKLRIVDFFLDNLLFDFTKKEVIEALGMLIHGLWYRKFGACSLRVIYVMCV